MTDEPTREIENTPTRSFGKPPTTSQAQPEQDETIVPNENGPALLEALVDEFTRRLRAGEHPAIAEFQQRHPELSDEIDELLSSVAMIEQLKSDSNHQSQKTDRMATLRDLKNLGGYQIIRELGRGGMGVVFEAIHETLGRRVAIKVMPTPLVDGEKHVARFRQEARSAAKLHHTNIVGVFGVGESDGVYYYVMDFVDGQALSDVINSAKAKKTDLADTGQMVDETVIVLSDDAKRAANAKTAQPKISAHAKDDPSFPNIDHAAAITSSNSQSQPILIRPHANTPQYFRWAAKIGASAADALSYAHASKILHRDIKPSNMVLDRKGVIWITDFGLAKDGANDVNLTATGTVLGTPQYMAPESLEGRYDVRSETYCLGLTLYELVTLQPAFAAGSPAEVIAAIATQKPTAPRKINSRIPIDLSTIIRKAISREPSQRYATAEAMRNDLIAFVEDRPISARRPSKVESIIRSARRNPMTAALLATSIFLLTAVAVTASVGYAITTNALRQEAEKTHRLKLQQQETEKARNQAVENFDQMKQQFARAESNVATTIKAFDEMFKQVIARGAGGGDVEIDGLREISGIESTVTAEDAAFLGKLVSFYEEFATNNADNEPLKAESAKAFRRVGNIYHRVGEVQAAIEAYKKSLRLYQEIFAQDPSSKEGLLTLAGIQYELSAASLKNGDALEAHRWSQESIGLLEKSPLVETDAEIRLELARTLTSMSLSVFRIASVAAPGLRSTGPDEFGRPGNRRPGGGRGNRAGRGAGSSRGKGGGKPEDGSPRERFSSRFSEFMRAGGGRRGLEKRYRQLVSKAITIVDALVEEDPENADYLSVQATCLFTAASSRIREDREAGLDLRNRAIKSLESLVADHPTTAEYRYLLALACSLGDSQPHRDDITLFTRSIEIVGQLLEQFPTNLDYHHLNASLRTKKSLYLMGSRQYDSAFSNLESARDSLRLLYDLTPSDRSFQVTKNVLTSALQRLANIYKQQGMTQKANDTENLAREIRNELRTRRGFLNPR